MLRRCALLASPRRALRWLVACVALTLGMIANALPVIAQEPTRRALVLYPDSNLNRAALTVGEAVRKRIAEQRSLDLQMHGEFLDLSRFSDEAHKRLIVRFLADKYAQLSPDIVLALGPDALRIAIANRSALAPDIPIVFCCASSATLGALDRPHDVTGIVSEFDLSKTMGLARLLQPDARRLVVIAGAAPFDQRWAQIARAQLADHERQFETTYLLGLTREALLSEVTKFSRDTIVILLTIFKDGAGRDFVPVDIGEEVAKASTAPVYGPYDSYLGRGTVGGYMDTLEAIGRQTGELMLRVLQGEDPKAIPPQISTTQGFRVDARQLERWHLSEKYLPPETVVMFKQPTIWESHHNAVVAVTVAFVALTSALGLLLIQIGRRRKAEAYLRDSEERLGFAAASAGIGLWQYDIKANRLWGSEHCCAVFGLPANCPLTAEALLRTVHPDDRHVAVAAVRAATFGDLADGVSEFRILRPNGQICWLQARGHTSGDQKGRPVRVSGIFRDVSGYKAAQLEAKQLSQRVLSIQDEERQRIAQELHDSTAQHLAAIGLNLIALRGPRGSKRGMNKVFEDIESSLDEAMKELRTFTYLLHPPALASDGLSATLRRYVEGFSRRTELRVALRTNATADELSQPLQQSILRIVQEALGNVHRHASARCAKVHLRRVADRFHLIIADNGHGVPPECCGSHGKSGPLPAGVGIAGMTARVRHLGGNLDIRSRSTGTTVHAVLPIAASNATRHVANG